MSRAVGADQKCARAVAAPETGTAAPAGLGTAEPGTAELGAAGLGVAEQKALELLRAEFPEVRWVWGRRFSWRPPRTVQLGPAQPHYVLLALHELGHCLEGHQEFKTEIGRLQLERAAWERARRVWRELQLEKQGIAWDEDFVEAQLDTYRDWLHARSRCPECGTTRFQTRDGAFHCPFCGEYKLG